MDRDLKALTGILAVSGIAHLIKPEPFERIVPEPLPHKRELVYVSGVAEVAAAALLARPQTRRFGGYAAAALLVGVFPANISMTLGAFRSSRASRSYKVGTVARLPMQLPMIRTAIKAARTSD